jgi:hypothetical protein
MREIGGRGKIEAIEAIETKHAAFPSNLVCLLSQSRGPLGSGSG